MSDDEHMDADDLAEFVHHHAQHLDDRERLELAEGIAFMLADASVPLDDAVIAMEQGYAQHRDAEADEEEA